MKGYDILIAVLFESHCPCEYGLEDCNRNGRPCLNDLTVTDDELDCRKCWQMAMEKEY